MESIKFSGIADFHRPIMTAAFNLISDGKRRGKVDEDGLVAVLGQQIMDKFISTKAEADYWLAKWQIDPNIDMPWDFGSWVDSISDPDIELVELSTMNDGTGEVKFEQLAWPSGGIGAIEQLVRIFGGTVLENSAI